MLLDGILLFYFLGFLVLFSLAYQITLLFLLLSPFNYLVFYVSVLFDFVVFFISLRSPHILISPYPSFLPSLSIVVEC
jgi:hypothetical protein